MMMNFSFGPVHASEKSQMECQNLKLLVIGHIYSVIERYYKSKDGIDKVLRFPSILTQLAEQVRQEYADVIIFTGDLTQHGTQQEFDILNEFVASLNTPTYFVPGNHDVVSLERKNTYLDNIGYLSKYVEINGHSIFLLDSASTANNRFTARVGGGLSTKSNSIIKRKNSEKNSCAKIAAMHQTIFDSRIWERE